VSLEVLSQTEQGRGGKLTATTQVFLKMELLSWCWKCWWWC